MSARPLAASALVLAMLATPALAQDAENGEKIFRRCQACHMVGPDAKHRVGPELNGVVGRTPGALEDFDYSEALVEFGASGAVWDEATLDAYLADPKKAVPGNKMAFAGLKKEEDRKDVIAYIEAAGGGGGS